MSTSVLEREDTQEVNRAPRRSHGHRGRGRPTPGACNAICGHIFVIGTRATPDLKLCEGCRDARVHQLVLDCSFCMTGQPLLPK